MLCVALSHDDSIAVLYRRYFPLLERKCARMLGSSAEAQEVAQEAFTRFWLRGPKDDTVQVVTAWLYRTSTRLAVDRLRQRRRAAALSAAWSGEALSGAAASTGGGAGSQVAARQQLERMARHTPRRELEVALLGRMDGLTQAEIAEVLNLSDRSVRRLLQRFDARVAAAEGGHDGEA